MAIPQTMEDRDGLIWFNNEFIIGIENEIKSRIYPSIDIAIDADAPKSTELDELNDVLALSAGNRHSLALIKDGSLVTWGTTAMGLGQIPEEAKDIEFIESGENHNLALSKKGITPKLFQSVLLLMKVTPSSNKL